MVTSIADLIPGDDNIQTISGTVVNVFDDEFILEDETGEILVDAFDLLERGEDLDLEVGQEVTVVGDLDDGDFDARSITLEDETTSEPAPTPDNNHSPDVTPIDELIRGDDIIQTISGTVVNVFDDEFILEDETGEILVDAFDLLERGEDLDLEVGQEVTVVGDLDDEDFDARSITTEDVSTNALRLTGGTAQIAYVAYYGRPADLGGRNFWNDVLTENDINYAPQAGDTLTGAQQDIYNRIVDEFGNSAEAERIFGTMSNAERVDRVYQHTFDRDAEAEGSAFWTEQLDNGNVTLANFALEVALGAQGEDIVTLNNKIESADLFSSSLDTQEEIDAYSGSSGENFGRTWLDEFGNTISSQEQVDLALNNLIDGSL